MVDITHLMTDSEILMACHKAFTQPSILFIYVSALVLYLVAIFSVVSLENLNVKKIIFSWLLFAILLGIVFVFTFVSPNAMQSFFNFFN